MSTSKPKSASTTQSKKEMNGDKGLDPAKVQELYDVANRMRITSINITDKAKSGHPTSACSCAEIIASLFFNEMKFDTKNPRDIHSDRFVISKGHACPILYAAWKEVGLLSDEDVMSLRKIDSDIEGHPTPRLNFIDVATGSLGQGLNCAVGMAYTGKYFDKASYRVYCLIGDGELAEGSVWEAFAFGSYYNLDNLVAILDVNRLGQSQATMLGHDIDTYQRRVESFGWQSYVVDGHSIKELDQALKLARGVEGKPAVIIAKTFKGKGIEHDPMIEDQIGWHGKPVGGKGIEAIEKFIKNKTGGALTVPAPVKNAPELNMDLKSIVLSEPPNYKSDEKVATRGAYGTALVKLGRSCDRIVALDGDVKNSTFSEKFLKEFPERFIECFIAEQNMVGAAIGCSTRNRTIPFCSTFATFFTRAADHLRMGAISMANIKCSGSHCGVSIGEDGPSQMGLEDLALFRSLPGSTVFYPSDAVSCERAVELAAQIHGICYIRTGRPATPILYEASTKFQIGKAHVLKSSKDDKMVILGAGVTINEAIKAAEKLKSEHKIEVCIIDPFTIKPLDVETLTKEAKRVGGKILTVEDHYYAGGIGEAVCCALRSTDGIKIECLAVDALPRSGPPDALLKMFGISADNIVDVAKKLIG